MDLELVAAFPTLMEAQIACSALRAAGVAAEVMDQYVSGIIPAARLEGFRVAAPYGEGARAKRLLKSILKEAG
jgi:hypothetical protein